MPLRPASARFRRSPYLVSYWKRGRCVVRNYLSGTSVAVPVRALDALAYFDRWRSVEDFAAHAGVPVSTARQAIATLARATLLERAGQSEHARERAMAAWKDWNPAAGFFHSATRHGRSEERRVGTEGR